MEWSELVGAASIPVLAATRKRLLELLEDDSVPLSQHARLIRDDPGLITRVISKTNYQRRKAGHHDVASTEVAVGMLGKGLLRELVSSADTLEDATRAASHRKGFRMALARARLTGTLAEHWGRTRNDSEPEANYLAGILHHAPELILWAQAGESMRLVYTHMQDEGEHFDHACDHALNADIHTLGRTLTRQQALPELVEKGFDTGQSPNSRGRGPALAALVAREVERGWYHDLMQELVGESARYTGAQEPEAIRRIQQAAVACSPHYRELGVPCPAALLPLTDDELLPVHPDLCLPRAGAAAAARPAGSQDGYEQALRELAHYLVRQDPGLNPAMRRIFKALHRDLGLDRVGFFAVSGDGSTMTAKMVLDGDEDSHLQGLRLSLADKNLFGLLVRQSQAVWVGEANRRKFARILPATFRERLGIPDFVAMPFEVEGKVTGLIYADRAGAPLDSLTYRYFKRICRLATRHAERV